MTAWTFDDGGRAAAGYRGDTGDCVTRAIAIACQMPYREVYDDMHDLLRAASPRVLGRNKSRSPRDGVPRKLYEPYLAEHGWLWTPTMFIGSGTTVHLDPDELPAGRLITRLSKHLCAVVDGLVHDTHDPSRRGTRAVYGYFTKET
jgi:hypothetical protein